MNIKFALFFQERVMNKIREKYFFYAFIKQNSKYNIYITMDWTVAEHDLVMAS